MTNATRSRKTDPSGEVPPPRDRGLPLLAATPRRLARTGFVGVALVVVLATSGCFKLSNTTRGVLSTSVGIPVTECASTEELELEINAEISFDWGDGSPVESGPVYWDAPTGVCRSHTYSSPGAYEGRISVSPGQSGWNQRLLTINVSEADPDYLFISGTCACHTSATLSAENLHAVVGEAPGHPTTYTWWFGDGTTQVTTQPVLTHRYPRAGTYVVSVRVVRPAYLDTFVGTHDAAEAWAGAPATVGR